MTEQIKRTAWNPRDYDIARGTTVQDCLAHAIYWFDQLTLKDAERYKAALNADQKITPFPAPVEPPSDTEVA